MERHGHFGEQEIPGVIDRQSIHRFPLGYPCQQAHPFRLQPGRCVGDRSDDGRAVALPSSEMDCSLPYENASKWLPLIGEQAGVGQDSKPTLGASYAFRQEYAPKVFSTADRIHCFESSPVRRTFSLEASGALRQEVSRPHRRLLRPHQQPPGTEVQSFSLAKISPERLWY